MRSAPEHAFNPVITFRTRCFSSWNTSYFPNGTGADPKWHVSSPKHAQSPTSSIIPFLGGRAGGACPGCITPGFVTAPREKPPAGIGLALQLRLIRVQIPDSSGACRTSAIGSRERGQALSVEHGIFFLQLSSFCGHSQSPQSLGNEQLSRAGWGQPGSSLSGLSSASLPRNRLMYLSGHCMAAASNTTHEAILRVVPSQGPACTSQLLFTNGRLGA